MSRDAYIVRQPSFQGLIGVAREDITPPNGIYARNWGAARQDTAEGVHRPLTLTCVTFRAGSHDPPLVLIGADLGWWRSREDEWAVRGAALEALELDESRLMFCLSHTHAGPSLQSENANKSGGELIGPYRQRVREAAISAARNALASQRPATLAWRYGKCDLATNRDLPEPNASRLICGFNPFAVADETLLAGRVVDGQQRVVATIVNYACHPTTLAWENRLISPDYVGAMRQVIEAATDAPALFLQGASGELAPAEQYTGDVAIADRNGRRLGHAVLATLEAMLPARTQLSYRGVVESGAALAVWRLEDHPPGSELRALMTAVKFPLKEMPSAEQLHEQWRQCDDAVLRERLSRKLAIRRVVGDETHVAMPLWVWRIGDSLLLGQPNEAYSQFQIELRKVFNHTTLAVMNLANGSAGYLPPRQMYEKDVYQVAQTPFAAGSLERLIESARQAMMEMVT